MNSKTLIRLLWSSLALLLAFNFSACSDDDDDDDNGVPIVGSWVEYENTLNGVPIPAGGWWVEFRGDGTGSSHDLSDPGYEDNFTWTVDGDQLSIVSATGEYPSQTVKFDISGSSCLVTFVDGDGTWVTYLQRLQGAKVLYDEWELESHYDSYNDEYVEESPFTIEFRSDGKYVSTLEGQAPREFPYSVDGCVIAFGTEPDPDDHMVFVVVGNTLYLTQYIWDSFGPGEPEPWLQAWRFSRR